MRKTGIYYIVGRVNTHVPVASFCSPRAENTLVKTSAGLATFVVRLTVTLVRNLHVRFFPVRKEGRKVKLKHAEVFKSFIRFRKRAVAAATRT